MHRDHRNVLIFLLMNFDPHCVLETFSAQKQELHCHFPFLSINSVMDIHWVIIPEYKKRWGCDLIDILGSWIDLNKDYLKKQAGAEQCQAQDPAS